ncbi:MAG: nitrile hydratase subunit beta, partial [Caulobacteraceae bacterium]
MNGVHDMGGMHGLGAIAPEAGEPVFHAVWEARVLALTLAVGAWGRWNIDASRHQRELIPGPDYLRMSYYEKWLTGLIELMVKTGLATRVEIETGRPAAGQARATPPLTAGRVAATLAVGGPASRDAPAPRRFEAGETVRARNINPAGHTRLPRYARGRLGVVERDHGVHVFPDTNAHGLGEQPRRL